MIKDSALVAYVGIQETFWRASTTGSRCFRSFETLLVAALIYWVLTIVFSVVQERIERRLRRERRAGMSGDDQAGCQRSTRLPGSTHPMRSRSATRSPSPVP